MKISVKIGSKEILYEEFLIKDITFYIKDEIKDYCKQNLQCFIYIEITKLKNFRIDNDLNNSYFIYTNVYNAKVSPEYIYKNIVIDYKILPNDKKYFYTQIDFNEEGEINFNFIQGNGQVYAKIVKKEEIEEHFNWNKRVKLPESEDKNLLNYNQIYQNITYTKDDTKKCEKGCELYIQVRSNEITYKRSEFTEFSFYINNKKNNIVNIRVNNYIKGTLENGISKNYKIKIPENYKKIGINLYSAYGKANIKYGKKLEWNILPENEFQRLIIKSEDIQQDSLKGAEFNISISSKYSFQEGELKEYLDFYLEIQPLYNNEKEYYNLIGDRSIICDTEKDTFCHVFIYLNNYSSYLNKIVYSISLTDVKNINIYANFHHEIDIINLKTYKDSIQQLFPTNEKKDQFSNGKKYLVLDTNQLNKSKYHYILLTIDSGTPNSLIKLILSGNNNNQTLIKFNNDKVVNWSGNTNYIFPNISSDSILNINVLEYKNFDLNKHTIGIIGNFFFDVSKDNESYRFESYSKSFIYFKYIKKTNENLCKINSNGKNVFYFDYTKEVFPQYIYTDLENAKLIQFSFIVNKYEEKNSDNLFNIYAYIINKKNLELKIINSQYIIEGDKINGYYFKYDETGVVEIPSDKIPNVQNDKYYAYVIIEKNEENKNKYKQIITNYLSKDKNEEAEPFIYYQTTYFSNLKNGEKESYIIKRNYANHQYLVIDVAENIPFNDNFDFAMYSYPNNTQLKFSISEYYGRKRIILFSFTNYLYIKFTVIKKFGLKNENAKNYSLIYFSTHYYDDLGMSFYYNHTIYIHKNESEKKTYLVVNNIRNKLGNGTYFIYIYEKNDEIDTNKKINTIYYGNKLNNEIYSKIYNENTYDNVKKFEINFSKKDMKKKYLIRILYEPLEKKEVIGRFIYNTTLVDYDSNGKDEPDEGEEEEEVEGNGKSTFLIVLVPTLLVIGIIAGVFFFYRKKRKDTKINLKKDDMILLPPMDNN